MVLRNPYPQLSETLNSLKPQNPKIFKSEKLDSLDSRNPETLMPKKPKPWFLETLNPRISEAITSLKLQKLLKTCTRNQVFKI
jgi:hypothetical protein